MLAPKTLVADRYEVVRSLGSGGSAEVFVVFDRRTGHDVALKLLKPEIGASVARERFHREIAVLARLEHPGILPLMDSGEHEGLPFFVTRLATGGTLRQQLRQLLQLPIEQALDVITAVATALDYAHSQGVVHRDIKPENILIDGGRIVVGDFGIARALDLAAADRVTDSTYVVGTPAYMSPEQALGGGPLHAATDVYSLGVVAYEMLAGALPYDGPTPQAILSRKANDPVPPLRTVRSTVPRYIERAIGKALSVVPADRFPTCGAFVAALRSADAVDERRTEYASVRRGTSLAIFLVAAGVLLFAGAMWRRATAPGTSGMSSTLPRVLVTEFENATGSDGQSFLGIAAVDWLTEGLHRTGLVSVVPTEHAVRASRAARSSGLRGDWIRELGREADAAFVVAGRYYRSRDSVWFHVQVTSSADGTLVGVIGPVGASASDPLQGVVALRSRLMGLLAQRADAGLAGFADASGVPYAFSAYRAFGTGVERYVNGDFAAAIPAFDAAIASDSAFTRAQLFSSISRSNLGRFAEADSLLQQLQRRRHELTDHDRAWLDFRAAFLRGDRLEALRAVRELDRLAPGTKATYNHAVEALENGYAAEARSVLNGLSPSSASMRGWLPYHEVLGAAHHMLGDFDEELREARRAVDRYPTRRYVRVGEIRALSALGKFGLLAERLAASESLPPDPYGTTGVRLLADAADEVDAHWGASAARPWRERLQRALAAADGRGADRALLWLRAANARALGDAAEALAASALLVRLDSTDADHVAAHGAALALAGRRVEAARMLQQLAGKAGRYDFGSRERARARIQAALGDVDAAIASLAVSFERGRDYNLWVHRDPDFRSLRGLPRFEALATLRQ